MNDCARFEYREADLLLNKVYGKALQYMTDDLTRAQKRGDQRQIKYEEAAMTSLKEAERAGLSYRDIECRAAGQRYSKSVWALQAMRRQERADVWAARARQERKSHWRTDRKNRALH
jgi:uncharacterized protein YecT (DUF1311 family)